MPTLPTSLRPGTPEWSALFSEATPWRVVAVDPLPSPDDTLDLTALVAGVSGPTCFLFGPGLYRIRAGLVPGTASHPMVFRGSGSVEAWLAQGRPATVFSSASVIDPRDPTVVVDAPAGVVFESIVFCANYGLTREGPGTRGDAPHGEESAVSGLARHANYRGGCVHVRGGPAALVACVLNAQYDFQVHCDASVAEAGCLRPLPAAVTADHHAALQQCDVVGGAVGVRGRQSCELVIEDCGFVLQQSLTLLGRVAASLRAAVAADAMGQAASWLANAPQAPPAAGDPCDLRACLAAVCGGRQPGVVGSAVILEDRCSASLSHLSFEAGPLSPVGPLPAAHAPAAADADALGRLYNAYAAAACVPVLDAGGASKGFLKDSVLTAGDAVANGHHVPVAGPAVRLGGESALWLKQCVVEGFRAGLLADQGTTGPDESSAAPDPMADRVLQAGGETPDPTGAAQDPYARYVGGEGAAGAAGPSAAYTLPERPPGTGSTTQPAPDRRCVAIVRSATAVIVEGSAAPTVLGCTLRHCSPVPLHPLVAALASAARVRGPCDGPDSTMLVTEASVPRICQCIFSAAMAPSNDDPAAMPCGVPAAALLLDGCCAAIVDHNAFYATDRGPAVIIRNRFHQPSSARRASTSGTGTTSDVLPTHLKHNTFYRRPPVSAATLPGLLAGSADGAPVPALEVLLAGLLFPPQKRAGGRAAPAHQASLVRLLQPAPSPTSEGASVGLRAAQTAAVLLGPHQRAVCSDNGLRYLLLADEERLLREAADLARTEAEQGTCTSTGIQVTRELTDAVLGAGATSDHPEAPDKGRAHAEAVDGYVVVAAVPLTAAFECDLYKALPPAEDGHTSTQAPRKPAGSAGTPTRSKAASARTASAPRAGSGKHPTVPAMNVAPAVIRSPRAERTDSERSVRIPTAPTAPSQQTRPRDARKQRPRPAAAAPAAEAQTPTGRSLRVDSDSSRRRPPSNNASLRSPHEGSISGPQRTAEDYERDIAQLKLEVQRLRGRLRQQPAQRPTDADERGSRAQPQRPPSARPLSARAPEPSPDFEAVADHLVRVGDYVWDYSKIDDFNRMLVPLSAVRRPVSAHSGRSASRTYGGDTSSGASAVPMSDAELAAQHRRYYARLPHRLHDHWLQRRQEEQAVRRAAADRLKADAPKLSRAQEQELARRMHDESCEHKAETLLLVRERVIRSERERGFSPVLSEARALAGGRPRNSFGEVAPMTAEELDEFTKRVYYEDLKFREENRESLVKRVHNEEDAAHGLLPTSRSRPGSAPAERPHTRAELEAYCNSLYRGHKDAAAAERAADALWAAEHANDDTDGTAKSNRGKGAKAKTIFVRRSKTLDELYPNMAERRRRAEEQARPWAEIQAYCAALHRGHSPVKMEEISSATAATAMRAAVIPPPPSNMQAK